MPTSIPSRPGGTRRRAVADARRIVVKLGTAVLTGDDGRLAARRVHGFANSIAALRRQGREVLVVTSGAVGLGAARLGMRGSPGRLVEKQACAAVGQGRLMATYAAAFDRRGVTVAQVLLTEDDFADRRRYLNLRRTVGRLLELGVLPIINENDTVSTAELEPQDRGAARRRSFGDNDRLSALVAGKIDAGLLVLLTDVGGLYDGDPRRGRARLIPLVEEVTPALERLAGGPRLGRGGMRTKLRAARMAAESGCATVIADGRLPRVLERVCAGERVGTLVLPRPPLSGKRRWIAFATGVAAGIVVTDGACRALAGGKASLLPAGAVAIHGRFSRGDVVGLLDERGREFARGIASYSSEDAERLLGMHSDRIVELVARPAGDSLVNRENLVLHASAGDA